MYAAEPVCGNIAWHEMQRHIVWWWLHIWAIYRFETQVIPNRIPITIAIYHLTHRGQVTHICVNRLGLRWYRLWPVAYLVPSRYLNQCWHIVDYSWRNKGQWKFDQNFHSRKWRWKWRLQNGSHFVSVSVRYLVSKGHHPQYVLPCDLAMTPIALVEPTQIRSFTFRRNFFI